MRRFAFALALALAGPAAADGDPARVAAEAASDLRAAAQALDEARRSGDRIGALTETVRAYEHGLGAMRTALRSAAIRERAIRARLDTESAALTRLLGGLQSMGRSPETAVLLHPDGPESAVRAAMLMSALAPELDAEVDTLRAELDELRILRALREDAFETLTEGLAGIRDARTDLAQAISNRTAPPTAATDEAAMQALLNSAETLDAFAANLVSDPGEGEDRFEDARGTLDLPVDGTLLLGFEAPDATGTARPGLLLGVEPGALVTAPWPSTVRYSGPFLDYGEVVILEPEDGYLLVLAGLGTVFAPLGTVLGDGDPIGLVPGQSPAADQILNETADPGGQVRTETLYIELRAGERPVDPGPWFALGRE